MTEAILLVACLVLAVAVVALVIAFRSLRVRMQQDVAAVRAELERRLAEVEVDRSASGGSVTGASGPSSTAGDAEYVITRLGSEDSDREPVDPPDARLFADLVLRESVVKAASFAHGVRRGLAPENRNRIWFEMRREVKRARKQRRADEREALREWKARKRASMREEDAA